MSNEPKDTKDEKKDTVKNSVEAAKDPKSKEALARTPKEEIRLEALKAIVEKVK